MAFDWKATLGVVAPTIATALGGPLAGLAIKALIGVLGLGEGASDDEIAKAVQGATPEQLLALKKADQEFAVRMRELDVDLTRIAAGDRDSARKMEIETKSWAPAILATVTVIGFFGVLIALISGEAVFPKEYELMVGSMFGALGAAMTQVYNYYFGSSAGSEQKNALLAKSKPAT